MYIVIEIQSGETVSTIVNSYDNFNAAVSKYHTVLAAAAISKVPVHSAALLNISGEEIMHESYQH